MTTIRQLFTAAAAIAILSSLALAQVRQIQMGGGMDANPGVGSGGSNKPVQGFVPVNGNDIMTGNVSGLAYFHGRVGTSSPYQFQGNLGTNSLAGFARQSAGNPTGGTYTGGYSTYYLPSNTVSTAGGALYSAPVGSGFDSALVPRASISPTASAAQINAAYGGISGNVAGGQAINRALPTNQIDPGSPGALNASPLFVLRTTELPLKKPDLGQPATNPASLGNPNSAATKPVNPNMVQGLVNTGKDERVAAQNPEYKAALVSETYLSLADELNKIKIADTKDNPGTGAGTGGGGGGLTNTIMSGNVPDIDPLTGQPRKIATLPSFRGPGMPGAGAPSSTQSAMTSRPIGSPSPKRLADLSDAELKAGGKIKPVRMAPMLGSTQVSGFDLMMSRAEQNLKGGRFLDAAESYHAALALKPDDPLALVGRAHAEMSAGIYAAAEYDLKFVYTRKPELVAVKYDVGSFIPAARQEFLLEDFKKLTAKKETASMASFLYCYLCYQSGRSTALQAELKSWGEREGHDDWQTIAQRTWTSK